MKRIIICIFAILLLAACSGRIDQNDTGFTKEATERTNPAMRYDCDALFFGDSITCDGNFDELFPNLRVVNLGVYGNTLEDLLRRVPEVRAESPARIFLLGGINCLRPDNVELCLDQYRELLEALKAACPSAAICVESVLPVGAELDPYGEENEAVRAFNEGLKSLAEALGCGFADLWAVYERDGCLNPALTRDGLNLNFNAYAPWAETITPFLN